MTLDGGAWQIETSVLAITYHSWKDTSVANQLLGTGEDLGYSEYALAQTIIRVGLFPNLEMQLGLTPYAALRPFFGDGSLALKYNILGNEGGPFALAAMLGIEHARADPCVLCVKAPFAALTSTIVVNEYLSLSLQLGLLEGSDQYLMASSWWFDPTLAPVVVLGFSPVEGLALHLEYLGEWSFGEPPASFVGPVDTFNRRTRFGLGILWQVSRRLAIDFGFVHTMPNLPYIGHPGYASQREFFAGVSVAL